MTNRYLRSLLMGASLVTAQLFLGGIALAQAADTETEADAPQYQDKITVTAARREQSLQDVPMAVTAINPADLATGGLTRLREVIEYSPGVNYSGGAHPNGNTVTMRGVAQTGRASTVGIYLDDVPLGSSTSFAAGPTLQFDAVQSDIQRIELIKGPQGTLYGSSSMGGLVRYITGDPSTSDVSGSLKMDLSETRRGGFNQNYSGRIGGPVASDRLGISLSGFYEEFDGFIDRSAGSPTGAAENVDAFERSGIFAKLVARPTDRITTNLFILNSELESAGANSIALIGPPYAPADGRYVTDEGANDLKDTFTVYAGTVSVDAGFAELVSSTSFQDRENSNSADLVASFGALVDILSGNPIGTTTSAPFTGLVKTERFVQELRLISNESDSFEWSLGAIYSDEDSSNIQMLEGFPADFLALDVDLSSGLKEVAGFGNFTFYFTPRFDMTVGARLAQVESSVALTDGPGLIVANVPETTSKDTIDTYSLNLRYRPNDSHSLYGRIASGYRPENANLPLLDINGDNAAPAIIATDTLWSYEAGAKGNLLGPSLTYDIAAWYINWKDLQTITYVNGAATGGNSNSDVTAYGFEGSLVARPTDRFTLIGNLAYTHSTLDDDETASFGALAGEDLPLLPDWTFSVRGDYSFPITTEVEGFLAGGVRYVGDRNSGFQGGVGANGATITPLIANIRLDSYIVANISAGVRKGRYTASVYANNLFDEYAYTGGAARPLAGGGFRANVNVLQPRTIGAVLKADF